MEGKIISKYKIDLEKVIYRKATSDDVPQMTEVFIASSQDYSGRMNFLPSPPPPKLPIEKFYHFAMSKGDFMVAEIDNKIVSLSGAVYRDHIWFLSAFWTLPTHQRSGIGYPLVKSVFEFGKERGLTIFFVYASIDFPAIASYMKLGMYPGYPVFNFEGEIPENKITTKTMNHQLSISTLQIDSIKQLDLTVRAVDRSIDHGYWQDIGSQGYQIENNGVLIGYFYVRNNIIGPIVSLSQEDHLDILKLAFKTVLDLNSGKNINLMVPGINQTALKFCLDLRMKIRSSAHFLTTQNFGKLENFIPSGAGLY